MTLVIAINILQRSLNNLNFIKALYMESKKSKQRGLVLFAVLGIRWESYAFDKLRLFCIEMVISLRHR